MVTYRIHNKQLKENLRVEFIYENYPIIAGTDELSLLIRFHYTGDTSKFSTQQQPLSQTSNPANKKDNNNQPEEDKSWFGSRLSAQFSNATRTLFLQELGDVNESEPLKKEKDQKVSLFLGYGQILGYYSINDSIIDHKIFSDLQKSTIMEGKFAGIHGLDVNPSEIENGGILAGLSSIYNTELNDLTDVDLASHLRFIPFYTTTQNIIFSELVFDSKQRTEENKSKETVKSYYFNLKLPKDIPPSYRSEALQIEYNFVLGYQIMEGSKLINKTVFVPLKISPFIDKFGRQPFYHLEKSRLNAKSENLTIEDVSAHSSLLRHDITSTGRRLSFWNIKRNIMKNEISSRRSSIAASFESLKKKPISDLKDYEKNAKVDEFFDILEDLDKTSVNDIIKIQENFEKNFNNESLLHFNVRDNLIHIMADYQQVQKLEYDPKKDDDSDIDYEYMLPKEQQTRYLIKQNHFKITEITLNRGIFKVGDLINLNISFKGSELESKGLEIQLLKEQIFYREEYLKKTEYGDPHTRITNKNNLEIVSFEKLLSTFNAKEVNVNILIPFETEPQFKTNFFQLKYYIQVRINLLDSYNTSRKRKENSGNEAAVEEAVNDTGNTATANGNEDGEESNINNQMNSVDFNKNLRRELYDLKCIFTDTTGSLLFKGTEYYSSGTEFVVRIPLIVLPNYEQNFGFLTNKI